MLKRLRLPDLALEFSLRYAGHQIVAGLDEAGRGAWAGPVTAAAVILPFDDSQLSRKLHGLQDSKALRPEEREIWYARLIQLAAVASIKFSRTLSNSLQLFLRQRRLVRAVPIFQLPQRSFYIDTLLKPQPETSKAHSYHVSRAFSYAFQHIDDARWVRSNIGASTPFFIFFSKQV